MNKAELLQKYPGLLMEKERNGKVRFRVRVEGKPDKRILLDIGPDHPLFTEAYYCARVGQKVQFAKEFIPILEATGNLKKMTRSMIASARQRADAEGNEFNISATDIIQMINWQEGKCALTGLPFDLRPAQTRRRPYAPSLDRKAVGGAYSVENVRITCVAANIARSDWPDEVLVEIARGIVSKSVPQFQKVSRRSD